MSMIQIKCIFVILKVLRRIFQSKREEVKGRWRKLRSFIICTLHQINIMRVTKSRRRWTGHVAYKKAMRNAYKSLVGKSK
jgi:hypothetical protein